MSVKYKLIQDNRETSKFRGQWYARATVSSVVTLKQMAEKIERSTTVTRSDILAVLDGLSSVMQEELLNGNRVIFDGIGSFKVGMSSGPAATPEEWTTTKNLRGSHIVFRPETVDHVSQGRRTRSARVLQEVKFEELRKYNPADSQQEPEP